MKPDNLWAPWRMQYIQSLCDLPEDGSDAARCFLCEAARPDLDDAARQALLVLHRTEHSVLMMNRYPYTNGHLLAAPHEHAPSLSDLSVAARSDLMELTELGCRALNEAMRPQGVNIGMNLGRCAGAGVPGHLHMHIVPRWNGDVSFMQVVGNVRVVPQALEESYDALRHALQTLV